MRKEKLWKHTQSITTIVHMIFIVKDVIEMVGVF
jgi:hypothetical protein